MSKRLAVTIATAAEALDCSRQTVWRLVRAGKIPAHEHEGLRGLRILWSDLEEYLSRATEGERAERRSIRRQLRVVGDRRG